jgi:hypothetical protein
LWALRALGVRRILAPTAVGSLTASYGPGTLVIPDQLVDRTTGRAQSFYDSHAVHVPFADPYCPSGRAHAIEAARKAGWVPAGSGTLVVIDGPRFSTRAESQWYAAQGWTLIGMTGHPEAVLARELAMCYTTLALITDTDAGVEEGDGVTQAEVFEVFGKNMTRLRELVAKIIAAIQAGREDDCARTRSTASASRSTYPDPLFTSSPNFSSRAFYELSPRGMVCAVTELDIPSTGTARMHVLHEGYVGLDGDDERVSGTVTLIIDGDAVIVVDPGMVAGREACLPPWPRTARPRRT